MRFLVNYSLILLLFSLLSVVQSYPLDDIPLIDITITDIQRHHLSGSDPNDSSLWDIWAQYRFKLTLTNLDGLNHEVQQINVSLFSVSTAGERIFQVWYNLSPFVDLPFSLSPSESWSHTFDFHPYYFNEFLLLRIDTIWFDLYVSEHNSSIYSLPSSNPPSPSTSINSLNLDNPTLLRIIIFSGILILLIVILQTKRGFR